MTVPTGRAIGAFARLDRLAAGRDMPISAMIQITERCNFRCRHCYQVHPPREEISTAGWVRIVRSLAGSGILFLTFSGGEPLVRRDLVDIAGEARRLGFALKLKTNGWLLDRGIADALRRLAFLEVHFSLYSARPRVHDHVTGTPGSFARAMRAGRMLARRGVGVVMNTPLMNLNCGEVDDLIALSERHGFGWSMDPHLNVCEDGGCSPAALRMDERQMRAVLGHPRLVDRRALLKAARRRRIEDRVCNAGRTSCVISPTGDVLVCPMIQAPLGNLAKADLAGIWKGSEARRRIESTSWASLHGCRDCDLVPYCVRCHGAALFEDGDMMGPSRLACQAARVRRDALLSRRVR